MKTYQADICIIAGGPAGLSAAVQAAEDGASVVVLEKSAAVGGAANMGMGPLGIGTKYQKRQMEGITVEKAFNMFMDYTHYQVDARLVRRYFEQSAETIEWLEEMGVEFEGAFRYFPQSEATWHIVKSEQGIGPRAASNMNKALYARSQELGVTILLSTPAEEIIMEDGRVAGVRARSQDGEEVRVDCRAAVVCTGGAGGSPEMIRELTGFRHGVDMFNFAIPGITGDGLRMAWAAGADRLPVRIEMAAVVEGVEDVAPSVQNVFSQPNLVVNLAGKRVMNEQYVQNTTYLSNVVANQKGRMCFNVVDTSIVRAYIRSGVDVVSLVRPREDVSDFKDQVKLLLDSGSKAIYVADTLEELSEQMGVDVEQFVETVETYNDYCDSVDEEFFKPKAYLRPLYKAPFYAMRIRPGGYGTVGGIRIDENCQALNREFEPVPGLYAAGADACNLYNDSYMFLLPGNSMGFAVNSGRIAGMSAAEYARE